jgi:hypothetical protein
VVVLDPRSFDKLYFFYYYIFDILEGEPWHSGKAVAFEVMGSSPGNSLLQKCRERLHT